MTKQIQQECTLAIGGMSCASCANRVEKALAKVPGVLSAEVNLVMETAQITTQPDMVKPEQLIDAVLAIGFQARLIQQENTQTAVPEIAAPKTVQLAQKNTADFWPVLLAALLSAPMLFAMVLSWMGGQVQLPGTWQWALATPVQFGLGWRFYKAGWRAIKSGSGNMDLLVALGTTAAYGLSVYLLISPQHAQMQHLYFESSTIVITLVLLGKWLEARAKKQTTTAIRALNALRPERATVLRNGQAVQLAIDAVRVGDVVLIRPGERIPVDRKSVV